MPCQPPPIAGEDTPAGDSLHLIRVHLKDIPSVPFPPGFGIRPMRLDEGSLWLAIERDAEQYLPMPDGTFEREFGKDLEAVPQRSFIVATAPGTAVGTISAWYSTYRNEEYGLIHWVAICRAYQGKGLGKAALAFALDKLAQWHDKALLGTQSKRLPAIKLYLDFGFVPDLEAPGAVERWRKVKANLAHPALDSLAL